MKPITPPPLHVSMIKHQALKYQASSTLAACEALWQFDGTIRRLPELFEDFMDLFGVRDLLVARGAFS